MSRVVEKKEEVLAVNIKVQERDDVVVLQFDKVVSWDRNRPVASDQGGGTDQSESDRDLKKLAEEKLRQVRLQVVGGIFLFSVGISVLAGIASSKVPIWISVIICLFSGLGTMFFGMAMEWIRIKQENDDLKSQAALTEMMRESQFRKQIRRVIADSRKECGGYAIETARAVSNRVANRLIARHAASLLNTEQREATIQETDQIVDEEIKALQDEIRDESESV